MPSYTFENLSGHEFELLVRDLLSAEQRRAFEVFMPGPDQGIDLRCIDDNGLIVQVKHLAGTGWHGLLSQLKRTELPKVRRLRPRQYGIATSVPLSPARKEIIVQLFAPFISSPAYVWGREDLNSLLRVHPNVERAHFKLWLTSTEVLNALIHARVSGRSRMVADEIAARSRLTVPTDHFAPAKALLERNRVIVLSGPPGVGKTTLAYALLADLIASGCELVAMSGDVDEAMEFHDPEPLQVFFYDDFLGMSTVAELFAKNEDARLASFLHAVRRSANKYLIMTTREYLLRTAQHAYPRLNDADIDLFKFALSLQEYTRVQRAKILYNHIYFSDLSSSAIESLLANSFYERIVDAPNYTPRAIDKIIRSARALEADNAGFGQFAYDSLLDPRHIWDQVFSQHLSSTQRSFLLTLATNRQMDLEDFLELAPAQLPQGIPQIDRTQAIQALRVLDQTFVKTYDVRGSRRIEVLDGSVNDFLLGYLAGNPSEIIRLASTARDFNQASFLVSFVAESKGLASQATARQVRHAALAAARRTGFPASCDSTDAPLRYYESPFQWLLHHASIWNLDDPGWNTEMCCYLEAQWREGHFDRWSVAKFWLQQAELPAQVSAWLNARESLVGELLLAPFDNVKDFEFARRFLESIGQDPRSLGEQFIPLAWSELARIESALATGEDALRRKGELTRLRLLCLDFRSSHDQSLQQLIDTLTRVIRRVSSDGGRGMAAFAAGRSRPTEAGATEHRNAADRIDLIFAGLVARTGSTTG